MLDATLFDPDRPRPIQATLPAWLSGPDDPEAVSELVVPWFYDPDDPYAVLMTPGGHGWYLARQLLTDAFACGSQGEGDIRVEVDPDQVRIHLSSPTGYAVLRLEHTAVWDFLRATYRQVRAGEEESRIDWDRELRTLAEKRRP